MSDELQALCFFAGVNSIHFGEKLLITKNPDPSKDERLFEQLGLKKLSFDKISPLDEGKVSVYDQVS